MLRLDIPANPTGPDFKRAIAAYIRRTPAASEAMSKGHHLNVVLSNEQIASLSALDGWQPLPGGRPVGRYFGCRIYRG